MTTRRDSRQVDRKGSKTKKLLAVSATAVLASLAVAVPVLAATPPVLPRDITIFPERDFVAIDGYRANTNLAVNVIRGGNVVGAARGTTDRTGFLEVNHPGGVCWGAGAGANLQVTPDIQPGDRIQVRNNSLNINDSNTTINVTAEQAFIHDNGTPADASDDTVKVQGTAKNAAGTDRIDISRLEQRIIQPDFIVEEADADPNDSRITRRDIRADSLGGRVQGPDGEQIGEGNLSYDSATSDPNDPNRFNWTATYTGLNAAERQLAVDGQTRVLSWLAVQGGERAGITIFEAGEVGGPGFGGCPPGPGGAVPTEPPTKPVQYSGFEADGVTPYDYLSKVVPKLAPTEGPNVNAANLHEVVVFPERDFVVAEGYPGGVSLNFVVRRPDVGIISTARGITSDSTPTNGVDDGLLEANHPGGVCWTGQTPDIKPKDVVDIVEYTDPDANQIGEAGEEATGGQTQRTIDVTANAARIVDPSATRTGDRQLVVTGTLKTANGTPVTASMPEAQMIETRMINPDLDDTIVGRRDIRASLTEDRLPAGASASFTFTAPGQWRAVYRGLDRSGPGQRNALVVASEGQTRALAWTAVAGGERQGITIFEVGEAGGPGFGGCPVPGGALEESNALPLPPATP